MLSVDTSDLHLVLVSDRLMEVWVLHELWKIDMDRGSQSGTHVGWAGGDVTEVLIISEFSFLLNLSSGDRESLENLENVRSLLHGNDSELILLVNPHEESLLLVVEDTSARWPVSVQVGGGEESVSLPVVKKKIVMSTQK